MVEVFVRSLVRLLSEVEAGMLRTMGRLSSVTRHSSCSTSRVTSLHQEAGRGREEVEVE